MNETKEYKYINLQYLEEMADGDKEFKEVMINDYLEKTPVGIRELEMALEQKDYTQVHFFAHKLKSSFQFMGVEELVARSVSIEHHCHENTGLEQIPGIVQEIREISVHAMKELEEELARIKAS